MDWFHGDIEELTLKNNYFRQVIFTGKHSQLVVMSLKPKEEIGMEVHNTVDQFLRFEKGSGLAIVNGEEKQVQAGDAVLIPAGSMHNVINTSETEELKLYTVYTPPNHPEGTIHKTKEEAESAEKKE